MLLRWQRRSMEGYMKANEGRFSTLQIIRKHEHKQSEVYLNRKPHISFKSILACLYKNACQQASQSSWNFSEYKIKYWRSKNSVTRQ